MLPLLPFYGIRLQYPLRDPGCAGGEKVRDGVVEMIASNPEAGNEIGGAGGARKVRIVGRGKGKSGGYRVITFYSGKDVPKFRKAELLGAFVLTGFSPENMGNVQRFGDSCS